MKKNLATIFSLIIFSSAFAQENGTTIVYNKSSATNISSEWSSYKTGIVISSSLAIFGCGLLAAAATEIPKTDEDARSQRKINQAGFILLGAGFAGFIITNLSFIPQKKVSVTSSANGIGIRYRL